MTNTEINNPEIAALLAESKMSALMVGEQIDSADASKDATAVYQSIGKAERNPTPHNQARAEGYSKWWINRHEDAARKIIQRRIDVRTASVARRGY